MFKLPSHLQAHIFAFDTTEKDKFICVLKELQLNFDKKLELYFVNVRKIKEFNKNMFSSSFYSRKLKTLVKQTNAYDTLVTQTIKLQPYINENIHNYSNDFKFNPMYDQILYMNYDPICNCCLCNNLDTELDNDSLSDESYINYASDCYQYESSDSD